MLRFVSVLLASALALVAPPCARAADLVVWWEQGFYAQEDAAVAEIVAAFEQGSGKQVDLVQFSQSEMLSTAQAALEAGQPPDFWFGSAASIHGVAQWAYEDRLADLASALAPVLDLFDADAIEASTLLDGKTGRRGLYALPMGRYSNNIHVWNSLLERAGFTLADVPNEWEAFWAFWCDKVQPAAAQGGRAGGYLGRRAAHGCGGWRHR